MNKKIILLSSACFSTTALYNHINPHYPVDTIITEQPMRGAALAKRRFKRLGFFRTMGQIFFSVLVTPFINAGSKKRVRAIISQYGFDETALPENKIRQVVSANDESTLQLVKELQPDIVLVNGTRILSKKLLDSTPAVFINMHTGITPQYRGVHGGYWALVNNDPEHFGVTVHLVDKGVDTGAVLYQSVIQATRKDNFITYPYLQFGEGIPLVLKAVEDAVNNKLSPVVPSGNKGVLWYHPTIWQYLYYRVFKNKK
ncbi:MAG TPA: formyl transferase [Chitinophagaceae bacterium]|jgi:folate-dependent phosphoribosylglycinamide formyltransferase PurN|nr:formyl transferase [Chitinophagaceae bacterium]